ncbi:MAG TPA: ABC transporter substrate-binding protein, partial [Amaricoccus sp.]|nr:ABC transporter substrate-binding protein [Amaricoccus sp.]
MSHPRRPRAIAVPLPGDDAARILAAALLLLAALLLAPFARAEATPDAVTNPDGTITSHGLSIFGDLKYPADFKHFDYVNPDAPKGGIHRTWDLGSYDSLTPFTEKGDAPATAWIVFDSLMASSLDSLDQMYGLIAESVT